MSRKCIILLMVVIIGILLFTGCSKNKSGVSTDKKTINIVCMTFPEYDWVRNIIGNDNQYIKVTQLIDSGVDLHSYQPGTEDMVEIGSCDILVYCGGESLKWVTKANKDKKTRIVNFMNLETFKGVEEEIVTGMQEEDGEEETDEKEYDEHVWLSIKNSEIFCKAIEAEIEKADPERASTYRDNLALYIKKLEELDQRFEETINKSSKDTLIFADRFPFRYLCDDYGLKYFAAFPGCSAETEASFDTIVFLAGKVDELQINRILIIDGSNEKIAKTVRENTEKKDAEILSLNSMQTIRDDKETYLSIMEDNLSVISEALR